jgi:hypothetical protein
MKRRDFFKYAAASTGYSVLINTRGWGAEPGPSLHDELSAKHEAVAPLHPSSEVVPCEPHMTVVDLDCDLFIAGGGMAGVCAAVAAARHGTKVVLVQDRSRLGGNSSSEVKMHIVGADLHGSRAGWREGGLIEEFRIEDAVNNPQRSREMWDLLLYNKCKLEPNITLLLDTVCSRAEVKDGAIQRVYARCDKTEHMYRVKAKLYADCTGDCRLGLESGATLRRGREAKSEFNEPLGLEKADLGTLGSTILFTSKKFDKPMPFTPPPYARKITKDMLRFRQIKSWEYGYWWNEWGGAIDTIRDNERIRFELLSIALGVWDYIKNSGAHPTSANWALDWIGMIPGKRGSRRMDGDHILTQHDIMGKHEQFTDAVCIGGWNMDDHPPGGFDRPDLKPFTTVYPPFPYNIPLRCLYSKNISNLMMAGRNISASHVAFTSTRVMATCSVIGQAMGTAAALCVKNKLSPRQLANDSSRVEELQQVLLRDDQTIRFKKNTDPLDLARKAEAVASSTVEGSDASNIINGYVRDLPGKWENRWGAKMDTENVYVQLEWKQPQKIRHVQITFDTGFQRQLTQTQDDSQNAKQVWGQPQPETVRDYELLYRAPGSSDFKSLGKFTGNYQRLRRHYFTPVEADALRLRVFATNGSDTARVYEVRCYA